MQGSGQYRIDRNRGLPHLRSKPYLAERSFRRHAMDHLPMATPAVAGASTPTHQPIPAPLTRAAIFLVVTVNSGDDAVAAVRSLCADLAALLRAVGFREPRENLSCIMGFGSDAWNRLFGEPRPAELHPFREIPRRIAPCGRHTRRRAVPHPRRAHGPLLRVGDTDHGAAGGRRYSGGRGARVSLFRQPRPAGLCRRDREPDRPGSGGRRR